MAHFFLKKTLRFATLGHVSKKKNNEITKTGRAIVILFLGIRLHAIVVNISYFLIVQACYDWNKYYRYWMVVNLGIGCRHCI